jgi:hypothetical protein
VNYNAIAVRTTIFLVRFNLFPLKKNLRNIITRASVFALALQHFLGKTPCKKLANLHPRHGNNFKEQGSKKPLFTAQIGGGRWIEKNVSLFANKLLLGYIATTISMRETL